MKHLTNRQKNNQPALTLLELVITVAIFAILTLIITRLYVQVLNAQDRILDEQNIVSDLNYSMGIFLDESRRATQQATAAPTCGGDACPNNNYFCSKSTNDMVCLVGKDATQVYYWKNANGLIEAHRGSNSYVITSNDVSFPSTFLFDEVTGRGDQLQIQIRAKGNDQYGQEIFYENYITR